MCACIMKALQHTKTYASVQYNLFLIAMSSWLDVYMLWISKEIHLNQVKIKRII